jgi:hypothetical protein
MRSARPWRSSSGSCGDRLEGRWLAVADGVARSEIVKLAIPSGSLACHPVLSAFGGDAVGAVLFAGAAAFGHHRTALGAVVGRRVGLGCRDGAGGSAQTRKQQRTARGADIGVPRRRGQNQRPIGQLLFSPAAKGFDQMMSPNVQRTLHTSGAVPAQSAGQRHFRTCRQNRRCPRRTLVTPRPVGRLNIVIRRPWRSDESSLDVVGLVDHTLTAAVELDGHACESEVSLRITERLSNSGDLVVVDGLTAYAVFRGQCSNRFALGQAFAQLTGLRLRK